MKITELNIAEFGCFKDKKIVFGTDNFNIIYGENESGKSTLLLFIKFMLYGLGRKSSSNSERERSVSWSGHTAAGSMSILQGGRAYRIERRYAEGTRGGSEKLSVVCLDDGSTVNVSDGVGEYFLGVPREVFESSAMIGQLASSNINGEKTAASIQNILSSADESVDTSKILKGLDAVRVTYRHKNKSVGSLYEAEQLIERRRGELNSAREATLALAEQEQKLKDTRKDYILVKADFEQKDALVSEFNKINLLKKFEKYHSMQKEYGSLEKNIQDFINENLKTEFLPNRGHIAELKLCAQNMLEREKERSARQSELDTLLMNYDGELAELGEGVAADGGIENLYQSFSDRKKKIKKINVIFSLLCGVGTALAAGGVLLALSGIYFGAILLLGTLAPIIFGIVGTKVKKQLKKENSLLLERYITDEGGLYQKLENCIKNYQAKILYEQSSAKKQAELAAAEQSLSNTVKILETLLQKTLPVCEPSYVFACGELERLERFCEAYEGLVRELETLERIIKNEEDSLSHYNEEAIKKQIGIDASTITPEMMAEAQRQRSFLLSKKEALEQKMFTLNEQLANLRANAKNPLPIADELAKLDENYKSDSEFYDALTLAIDSIAKAGEAINGNVMPVIAEHAGRLLARISQDRYTVLRATSTLGLSVDSDGFGINSEYLSGGTRDAAYISLRIALLCRIFEEELPPLILDEALCQIDDIRSERVISLIAELASNGMQCILFTSHKREGEICKRLGYEHNKIIL